jgi:hypothetical protein
MAAYTYGESLHLLRVENAMACRIMSCGPEDEVADAAPVVDTDGKLVGLLSLDDLAWESQRSPKGKHQTRIGDSCRGRLRFHLCRALPPPVRS